jgi:tRNA G18 (ribose-2'-O)-methylase SpoU
LICVIRIVDNDSHFYFRLVGVEQTQDSTRLDKFQFPVKTVLLLGNEKEGIPVELIQVKLKLLLHGTKK